jgi:hypothetical protein
MYGNPHKLPEPVRSATLFPEWGEPEAIKISRLRGIRYGRNERTYEKAEETDNRI